MNQRFEFRRELGRGGMGAVFEAFDHERQETVALKMLHRADAETIFQIKQEFRSLSEVVHPRLVSMHELQCQDDQWFFTMEYIPDGKSLTSFVRERATLAWETPESGTEPAIETVQVNTGTLSSFETQTLQAQSSAATLLEGSALATSAIQTSDAAAITMLSGPAELDCNGLGNEAAPNQPRRTLGSADIQTIVALFRQVAEGVQELHRRHILHRDLKPGNVMVRGDGSVHILDFGLAVARVPSSAPSGRIEKGISGTVAYMAPEQAASQPLTEAGDWYAVGVMLFEVLTGELPFSGAPGSILRRKLSYEAPSVTTRASGIPPELASLCDSLLRRDPTDRPTGHQVLAAFGTLDNSEQILLPDETIFVGRTAYLDRLRDAFTHSAQSLAIVHLHGRSGSGKSALMSHFVDDLKGLSDVLVIRSRCYEQESVPYKSVDGLADEIAWWLQQRSDTEQRALTPRTAHALARMFPVFKSVPSIAHAEAALDATTDLAELRRQSFQALGELLAGIAGQCHLILCIDDLQWGDADGVEILAGALAQVTTRVLVLATYRDEFVETSAALQALSRLEESLPGLRVEDILVKPLSEDEARELIRLRSPHASTEDLERLVRQAEGNPYFIEELARQVGSGARADHNSGLALDDILWSRIARLPDSEMRLLEMIAVSGQPIRLLDAQKASGLERAPFSVLTSLRMHRFVRSSGAGLRDQVETYHDRIRETVLSRLPSDARRNRHASLAFSLESSGDATSDTLAVHFEAGGEPALSGKYYEVAARESAQTLAFSRAEEFYRKARALVDDRLARTRITESLIHLKTDLAQFPEAYELGREGLADLGLAIPAKFFPPGFLADLAKSWLLFRNRRVASIIELPESTDPQHNVRIALLAAIGKAAYQIRPELCIAIMLKIVNNSVKLGNTRDSAIGYMAVGAIFIGGILGRYDAGYEFGRASLQLVDRFAADRIRAEVNFVVGYFGTSWRRPAAEAETLWQVAHRSGLETRDLFHTGCASCATVMSQFMRGVEFDALEPLSAEYVALLERFGLREPLSAVLAVRRTMEALRDPESRRSRRSTVADDSAQASFGSRHIAHYDLLLRMQEQYLFGEYDAAIETGRLSARFQKDSKGMLHSTEHIFYHSLASMAACCDRGTKLPFSRRMSINRGIRMFENWAQSCPSNFLARSLLLRGQERAAAGDLKTAIERFERSTEAALNTNQPHIAGLACRLASQTHAQWGQAKPQRDKLAEAKQHYTRWGATGYAQWIA